MTTHPAYISSVSAGSRLSEHLVISWLGLFAALPLGCLIAGFGVAAVSFFSTSSATLGNVLFIWLSSAALGITLGFLPAFLYGAPAYALWTWRYGPNLMIALLISVIPGALVWLIASGTGLEGLILLGYAIPVALILHLMIQHRFRARRNSELESTEPEVPT